MIELALMYEQPWLHVGFASLHLVAGQGLSSWLYRRRYGGSPLVLYRAGGSSAHQRITRGIGAMSACWAAGMMAWAWSGWFRATWAGEALWGPTMGLGWALASAGLLWMVAAQVDMGASFRVGQDEQERTALVTGGMHALSRNPIYVGSFACLAGLSLWAPCVWVLVACAGIGALMHLLTLAEERHLEQVHGEAWLDYKRRVRRYL